MAHGGGGSWLRRGGVEGSGHVAPAHGLEAELGSGQVAHGHGGGEVRSGGSWWRWGRIGSEGSGDSWSRGSQVAHRLEGGPSTDSVPSVFKKIPFCDLHIPHSPPTLQVICFRSQDIFRSTRIMCLGSAHPYPPKET